MTINSQTKCNHLGMVYWNGDDWYCKRCGEILEGPPEDWTEEEIAEVKEQL